MWSDWLSAGMATVFRIGTNLAKLKLATSGELLLGADANRR